ncbi:MAG: MASE1 domain-containing protein [Sphingobacteriales bacterium]
MRDKAETAELKIPAFRGVASAASYLLELLITVASYIGLAGAGLLLPSIYPSATPLWPPTGFVLAFVLLRGYRIWPAIIAGSFSSYLIVSQSLLETGSIVVGTVLAALVGAWLLGRWSNGPKTFATPSSIAKFAFISFAPTAMIRSSVALAGFILANNIGFADSVVTLVTWWLIDATGTLIIAPVVVLWAVTPLRPFSKWSFFESILVLILATAIAIVAYSPLVNSKLVSSNLNSLLAYRGLAAFLILIPLMWAALRGSQRNVATAALIFSAIALWGLSAASNGSPKADLNGALLFLLGVSLSVSVPPLILAAAIAIHQSTQARLLFTQEQLNREIERITLALNNTKRQFQILVESVTDYAIFMVDRAGQIASWNNAAQQITGYTAEETIGKHFGMFYRPDERRAGEPNRALELASQKGKHEVEGWRVRKNGTPFFVTGSVSSMRDDNGTLLGFAYVLRDATERRDAQEKLVQAREQLAMAQKMEAIGKLTGGIAHDFNNLLMIIGGNAQTFKRLLDPKLPKAIEAIQTAAKRGESLTRQLLTFSRRQHLSPTVIDLNVAIKNMRTMIESSLRGNIVYDEQISGSVWPVKVDLAELELAIVNLAVNARDAMPNGGTFTLSIHNADRELGDERKGTFVALKFSDTGMGIPPNLLSQIFDPFFTTKEVGKGSGLGLSQVYGFAHQAGGTVTAESKVGQGTTIKVYLPLCADEQIASEEVSAAKTEHSRPTVLVVDDSADVAEVTSSFFEQLGYETVYRDSAEAALKLLADGTKIDLVFSDIVMPGTIDGVGLAREIRSRYPRLPVILTTGYSDAAQAAPQDFKILHKPFGAEALRDFIQDMTAVSSP